MRPNCWAHAEIWRVASPRHTIAKGPEPFSKPLELYLGTVVKYSESCVAGLKIELVGGHVLPDHLHMCLEIPPKYGVANTVGKLKGKSAMLIQRSMDGSAILWDLSSRLAAIA